MYKVTAAANGGRSGHVATGDKKLSHKLSYPVELGGTGEGVNPEMLFAAGYSACFSSAILHAAKVQGLNLRVAPVAATIGLNGNETGGFELSAHLSVNLDMDQNDAEALVHAAHQVCPYSNATRGNIPVEIEVNGKALVSAT